MKLSVAASLYLTSIIVSVTACHSNAEQTDDEGLFVTAAKIALTEDWHDPSSAQYRNVIYQETSFGKVVCGEVNGKNALGGYIGFQRFIVTEGKNGLSAKLPDDGTEKWLLNDEQRQAYRDGICPLPQLR